MAERSERASEGEVSHPGLHLEVKTLGHASHSLSKSPANYESRIMTNEWARVDQESNRAQRKNGRRPKIRG